MIVQPTMGEVVEVGNPRSVYPYPMQTEGPWFYHPFLLSTSLMTALGPLNLEIFLAKCLGPLLEYRRSSLALEAVNLSLLVVVDTPAEEVVVVEEEVVDVGVADGARLAFQHRFSAVGSGPRLRTLPGTHYCGRRGW